MLFKLQTAMSNDELTGPAYRVQEHNAVQAS